MFPLRRPLSLCWHLGSKARVVIRSIFPFLWGLFRLQCLPVFNHATDLKRKALGEDEPQRAHPVGSGLPERTGEVRCALLGKSTSFAWTRLSHIRMSVSGPSRGIGIVAMPEWETTGQRLLRHLRAIFASRFDLLVY